MRYLTIDFDRWGPEYLLDPNTNKMCCLGFACKILGKTESEMEYVEMPSALDFEDEVTERFIDDQIDAAVLNDGFHDFYPEHVDVARKRLKELRKLFKDNGTVLRVRNLPEELR